MFLEVPLSTAKNLGLKLENDTITFANKKSLGEKFIDVLKYPVMKMPLDIANSVLEGLQKIPGLKKNKFINNLFDKKILKNRRDFLKNTSDVAGIEHYFKMSEDPKQKDKIFSEAHKRFNPLVSNFNNTTERTLTRLVTGAIPAFFLANDAYNLSIYMNDNKQMAKADKKRRFNQEVTRIAITAGAAFTTLSLFSSNTAKSTIISMSILTFVSEIIGRMIAGTPVLPVNEKSAKRYAKSQGKEQMFESSTQKTGEVNNSEEQRFKPKNPLRPKEGKLTLKNALKLVGLLVVAGFGIEKASGIKSVKKMLKNLNDKYKGLYLKDSIISRKDFDVLVKKLDDEGFSGFAERYRKIVENQKGDLLNLGQIKDKLRYTIIHQILTFPVRFTWNTLMMPYKNIVKPLLKAINKDTKKIIENKIVKKSKNAEELKKEAEDKIKKEFEMLQNSIQFLKTVSGKSDYKAKINKSTLASLDDITKSNHDGSNIATIIKNSTGTITSAFLIADNYNLVMIDSEGKNKELAEQKAKERTIQRGARLAYGAFLIKFFNDLFSKTYNSGLIGVQFVNVLQVISTEILERKSVGLPLTESTKEKIKKKETENIQATGLKGAYYKAMAKLTGKKPLSERKD